MKRTICDRMTALAGGLLLVIAFVDMLGAQAQKTAVARSESMNPGPKIGEIIPDFDARDQDGNKRTFWDLRGSNGLLLLVYRSADW